MDIETMMLICFKEVKETNEETARIIFDEITKNNEAVAALNKEMQMWNELKNGQALNSEPSKHLGVLANESHTRDGKEFNYMEYGGLSMADLDAILADQNSTDAERAAAQYFKDNPKMFEYVDTWHSGGTGDGIITWDDAGDFRTTKPGDFQKEFITGVTKTLQDKIDALNSLNQLRMLSLQKAQSNIQAVMEAMTGCIRKSSDTLMSISRNL